MFGKREEKDGVVKIKSIYDLKLHKIRPSDLNKIYEDQNGQKYKLRYNPQKKKVDIVKLVKGVLNGKYVKTKYDEISKDKQIQTHVKYRMAEMTKEVMGSKPEQLKKPAPMPAKPAQTPVPKEEKEEMITCLKDIFGIMEHMGERFKIIEKNIFDSQILSERYSYEDKILLDDLFRMFNADIMGEFKNGKERYEDILKGYDDGRLSQKKLSDEIKAKLATKPKESQILFLREMEMEDIFYNIFLSIKKAFNDINYKISTISADKISARSYHERQKFEDAKFLLDVCFKDIERILDYLKKSKQEMES
ncbi:MAG: hypothetical protein JW827_11830 [Spirochaetes bacterium]|nr:hypothetical protein [Spirochaetota bacterium]